MQDSALLHRQAFRAENLSIWLQLCLISEYSFCMRIRAHPCLARLWKYSLFPTSALLALSSYRSPPSYRTPPDC